MAFDHDGDYGVFNVSHSRRRRTRHVNSVERGCSTGKPQSSALGRILEYVP
jgi:hypothetical protein